MVPVRFQLHDQELYVAREFTSGVGGTGFVFSKNEELVTYKANSVAACCPLQAEALALLDVVSRVYEKPVC